MTKNTLIEFPCNFPIKIIGSLSLDFLVEDFIKDIEQITKKHFPGFSNEALTHKASKQSNYLAITVTVFAENQDRLDDFYKEITKHPAIKMVL
ncbi:MAG: YbeD family protein [Legionellales bacterium]